MKTSGLNRLMNGCSSERAVSPSRIRTASTSSIASAAWRAKTFARPGSSPMPRRAVRPCSRHVPWRASWLFPPPARSM